MTRVLVLVLMALLFIVIALTTVLGVAASRLLRHAVAAVALATLLAAAALFSVVLSNGYIDGLALYFMWPYVPVAFLAATLAVLCDRYVRNVGRT